MARKIDRTKFIGGSDSAAVLGVSPFCTPLELYMRKRGELQEQSETEAMRWGKLLEPAILKRFKQTTGVAMKRNMHLHHGMHPWMRATLDAFVPASACVVEAKSAIDDDEWGDEEAGEIPEHYAPQVQHNIAVASSALGVEVKSAYVPVLFLRRRRFAVYRVARDESFARDLIDAEHAFWQRVQSGTPPDPINAADAMRRWWKDNGANVEVGDDLALAVSAFKQSKEQEKKLKDDIERAGDALRIAFGENAALTYQGKVIATYKAQVDRRIDIDKLRAKYPEIATDCTKVDMHKRVLRLK